MTRPSTGPLSILPKSKRFSLDTTSELNASQRAERLKELEAMADKPATWEEALEYAAEWLELEGPEAKTTEAAN